MMLVLSLALMLLAGAIAGVVIGSAWTRGLTRNEDPPNE